MKGQHLVVYQGKVRQLVCGRFRVLALDLREVEIDTSQEKQHSSHVYGQIYLKLASMNDNKSKCNFICFFFCTFIGQSLRKMPCKTAQFSSG